MKEKRVNAIYDDIAVNKSAGRQGFRSGDRCEVLDTIPIRTISFQIVVQAIGSVSGFKVLALLQLAPFYALFSLERFL